jgi:4-amino-4-deoxy-L-arabinose transferase-like glycosyltransferase
MGLPVRQRMKLDHIDRMLRGTDPKLAALYAIFGRLTRDEEIPRFEQLRHGIAAKLAWFRLVLAAVARRLHIRFRRRQRIVLFYPLAIALTVGSIVLAVRSSPARSCLPSRVAATAKNFNRSNLCRPASYVSPLNYGH